MPTFPRWPEPDPVTPRELQDHAAYWRSEARKAMEEAVRRPWWSPARRGWEARAEECHARADRLDPPTFVSVGDVLRGALSRLDVAD